MLSSRTRRSPALAAATLLAGLSMACGEDSAPPCDPATAFVARQGASLTLCDEPFRFAGANNYYLAYKQEPAVLDVLEAAAAMDLRVLRVWGFLDGEAQAGVVLQPSPGVYDEAGFARFDLLLARARELDLRLVIPLVNNWGDFGGMEQYVHWVDPAREHDDFYTNPAIRDLYRAYVEHFISRVNTVTGVAYRDDPTIMTWELTNEARCESDPSGETLTRWADEMSAHVRALDPNHLIALGDEGLLRREGEAAKTWAHDGSKGVDWERLLTLPNLDYGTVHLYPTHWWTDTSEVGHDEKLGTEWIIDHLETARALGKPAVLEEYGIASESGLERSLIYQLWNDAVLDHGGAGSMFWLLSGIDDQGPLPDDLYPDYDGYRVSYPSDDATLLSEYGARLAGVPLPRAPRVGFYAPVPGARIAREHEVAVKVLAYEEVVESISVSTTGADRRIAVADPDGDGYYTGTWPAPSALEPAEVELEAIVRFASGKRVSGKSHARRSAPTGAMRTFTFDEDLEGWSQDGTFQASFGVPEIEHSAELAALRVNVDFPGVNDWEEVRIQRGSLPELAGAGGVQLDLLLPEALVPSTGALSPYVVFDPGWLKIGVEENTTNIAELEPVTLAGVAYRRLRAVVVVPPEAAIDGATSLHLGIVGKALQYRGPIYVDDVRLLPRP